MIVPRASRASTRKTLEAAAPAAPMLATNKANKKRKDTPVTPPTEQSVDPSAVPPTRKGKGSKKKKVGEVVPHVSEIINADANQTALVDPALLHAEYAKKFAELEAQHATELAAAKQPTIPPATPKGISGIDKSVLALANLGLDTALLLEQANKVSSGPDMADQDKEKEKSSKVRSSSLVATHPHLGTSSHAMRYSPQLRGTPHAVLTLIKGYAAMVLTRINGHAVCAFP